MKKILLFTDCLGAGGAQRQLVGLAIMLKENGYNVKVSTYYNIDFYKKQLDDAGVPNELIPGADNTKKRILAVRNYFKQEQPDWVIAYQETPSLVACAAKVLGCKYKLIVSERNTTQSIGLNERVRFFLYHWADKIVPNSYAQENFLTSHYQWMSAKIKVITNFVDLDHFTPHYHNLHKQFRVLIVATIRDSKNTMGMLNAISILKSRGINCHFDWYGKSMEFKQYLDKCNDYIINHDLSDMIALKEKTKEIVRQYQKADVFCLPSFYEGTPNVICEAVSCGLPIAASNVCDNSIYVVEGINGVLFNPSSPTDIADNFLMLFNRLRQDYSSFQHNSRRIAEEKLSKSLFLEQYLSIIELQESFV